MIISNTKPYIVFWGVFNISGKGSNLWNVTYSTELCPIGITSLWLAKLATDPSQGNTGSVDMSQLHHPILNLRLSIYPRKIAGLLVGWCFSFFPLKYIKNTQGLVSTYPVGWR